MKKYYIEEKKTILLFKQKKENCGPIDMTTISNF